MSPPDSPGNQAPIPDDVVDRLRAAGVCLSDVVSETPKSVLAEGRYENRRVAVKVLRDGQEDFWISAWHREIRINEAFRSAETAVPVAVPRMLHTDHTAVMVFDWVDGQRLDNDRYPQRRLADSEVDTVLSTISAINRWHPPPASGVGTVVDYQDKVARYHGLGLLTDDDRAALQYLLSAAGTPDQFNHADLLPTNLLLSKSAATVIDWEFAGLYLPGYDLAMAYTLFGVETPAIRRRIDTIVAVCGIEIGFAVNLAAIIVREIRMHRELPAGTPLRGPVLAALEHALTQARHRLRTLA